MTKAAPALFKDGEASVQRLRRYLDGEESDVSLCSFFMLAAYLHSWFGGLNFSPSIYLVVSHVD